MRSQITRQLRLLHSYRASDPIEEELRGWSYHHPPIKPRRYLSLSMGDVAYRYCETKRDVYLRRNGVQGEANQALNHGLSVHRIFSTISREVSRLTLSGLPPWDVVSILMSRCSKLSRECQDRSGCEQACKSFSLDLISDYFDSTSFIPTISEFRVDGTPLGLSPRLSVDAITQFSMVVEIKTGTPQDFHKLALAGYALALESSLELPLDFGTLIYVRGGELRYESHYVSPDLRKEFLDSRDEVISMLSEDRDPGLPTVCYPSCPFLSHCRGG
ncbi:MULTISPECIES: type I-A CRISPR-associated protein Cas4/Csa1 [Metallosphaera]|uniref:CRISPR-associated protein, Csa1 family n=2 Tax=Metallosphaera sedula TaxID=43687 RepID=A4YFV5_METS5|nr:MULTISPECIES: type I-A CRISPR-associated protein Cas4/Csa1 [Metallosphaera]ABP95307.1 CRISPR-associated protein, Csa1 family [Metallosphaera sedula DSM 5348]AIM27293.1 CRISPR-associated protein, Csa1 family [Metallosphaera sedula]AKV74179.1 CRISPR-associated protein Cse1 [Metallosphaera sedula]AKV76418.1 CRISPR-associated protein Cse1 [Metallosphaera sedula]AKV78670.1 CRISPR-associated protein Cse1 [Metallosphaera sedula]